eukprot:581669-Amorphochlora_amoeboformis.AAC.1
MPQVPEITVQCFENQRFWPGTGWSSSLLPTDRYGWSSADGKREVKKADFPLPAGWHWKITKDSDAEGWRYVVGKVALRRDFRGYYSALLGYY